MNIDERALGAAVDKAADHGWMFETAKHRMDLRSIITAYLAALPALPSAEPGRDRIEPPEGKLRVRVCVGQDEYGNWVATGAKGLPDDIAKSEVTDRVLTDYWRPQFRWIEADVTPWQPPAEETVQGREVEG